MSVERRFHPRFDVDLPVSISFADEECILDTCAINLSLSGMQVQASKTVVDSILQHCQHPAEFYVSINTEQLSFEKIKVRLIINRRISQQAFQLGLKFCGPSQEQQSSLNDYIQHCKNT